MTFGTFNNSLIVQHALGDPKMRMDFKQFGWAGAPSVGAPMCIVMGFTDSKPSKMFLNYKKPLKVGATRAGSTGYDLPLIMNKTLRTKFDVKWIFSDRSRCRPVRLRIDWKSFARRLSKH